MEMKKNHILVGQGTWYAAKDQSFCLTLLNQTPSVTQGPCVAAYLLSASPQLGLSTRAAAEIGHVQDGLDSLKYINNNICTLLRQLVLYRLSRKGRVQVMISWAVVTTLWNTLLLEALKCSLWSSARRTLAVFVWGGCSWALSGNTVSAVPF